MGIWYGVRLKLALLICPELSVEGRLKATASVGFFDVAAARQAAKSIKMGRPERALTPDGLLRKGFIDDQWARDFYRARKLSPDFGRAGNVAGHRQPVGRAGQQGEGEEIAVGLGAVGVMLDVGNGALCCTRDELIDGLDEAEKHNLHAVHLVVDDLDVLSERVRHDRPFSLSDAVADGTSSGDSAKADSCQVVQS